MDLGQTLEISASGLRAQRLRLDVVASNLANAGSTRNADGTGPYRRRAVVFRSAPVEHGFEQALQSSTQARAVRTVEVARIVEDQSPPRMVHNPEHPDANEEGYVAYPNVNTVTEMVDLMTATRSYEANVQAIHALRAMSEAALSIGASGR